MKPIKAFLHTDEGKIILVGATAISLLIWMLISAINRDNEQWRAFVEENGCVVVAHTRGQTALGVGTGVSTSGHMHTGTTVYSTSPTSTWRCSDGITYTR